MTQESKSQMEKKQVKLAVKALVAHLQKNEKQMKKKDQLFEADQVFWLIFSFKKIPQVINKPKKIPLPHSMSEHKEICFISSEPGKKLKERFLANGIENITKVISLTKLRKEYKSFKQKRELCSSYDMFLCDEKIYHLVCKSFGKEFFKHKKDPMPINMTTSNMKSEIDKTLQCTLLRMGHGPCSALKVGYPFKHTEKELIENIAHAIQVSVSKVPGQWKNIQKIFLKSTSTIALPIFNAMEETNSQLEETDKINGGVDEITPKKKKRKSESVANKENPDSSQSVSKSSAEPSLEETSMKKKKKKIVSKKKVSKVTKK